MITIPINTMKTLKVGAEDIIMMHFPTDRFRKIIPSHYHPPVVDKLGFQIALLAQNCEINSFNNDETGPNDELHLWLQVGSSNPGALMKDADRMMPSMHWFALLSATSNNTARSYLQSFGFTPLNLEKIELQEHSGSLVFKDEGLIEWTIIGPGKELPRVGVNHVIFVAADGPDAVGHSVAALVSNTVMGQPGIINIQTAALEPFLLKGERFSTVIHRMPKLEANVTWQKH
jgi:hypothetical protein